MGNYKIENFTGIFEDAIPQELCSDAIKFFHNMREMGLCYDRQYNGTGTNKVIKDDSSFCSADVPLKGGAVFSEFLSIFWANIYPIYAKKYGVLEESGSHLIYELKIQQTDIGQGYHVWHYESCEKRLANRLLTFILYLNDVDEGGETEFLYYPKRVKPKTGTVVLWPAAFTHAHRGNPPISNCKYIITGWVEF